MAASGTAVLTGAIINIVTALIALLVFCWLRTWHKAAKFYDSKRHTPDVKVKPLAIPQTFFGWVWPTLTYPEPHVIQSCGLDTAIYLRLLSFGVELFAYVTAWALVVILPTNYTGDEVDNLMSSGDGNYAFTNFDKLSLSNVPPGSPRLWVHTVSVWLITFLTLRLLWRFSKESVILRVQFLGNSTRSGPTHSVLVTDIPAVMEATEAGCKARAHEDKERKQAEEQEAKRLKDLKKKQDMRKSATSTSQVPILTSPLVTSTSAMAASETHKPEGVVSEGDVRIEVPPPAPAASVETELSEEPAASATATAKQPAPRTSTASGATVPTATLAATAGDAEQGKGAKGQGLRKRQVFTYDLDVPSLDPKFTAKEQLEAGTTPLELVREEFKLVYGEEQVEAVQLVYDQSGLSKLVPEYEQRKQQLEDFLDAVKYKQANNMPLEPPKVTLLFPDEWCKERYGGGMIKKVDGVPFWRDRLLYLEEKILAAQEEARRLIWPAGFVTFKTRVAQSVSSTGLHQHDETAWAVRPAPGPTELIWNNLGMTSPMRTSRGVIMLVLFWLLVFFYMIPVAAIQGLIDVPKLAKTPGLSAFLNAPVVKQLIQAIVPGLVLKVFLALLPAILAFMMRMAGAVSLGEVDLGVVSRFFIFQVVIVFFGNTIASSFFSQAEQWVNDPTSVVSVLGTAIPQASTFFITYIWVGLAGTAISFLRVVGLVLMWLFMWLAGSPRAQRRVYEEQYTTYGVSVTGHTITILLGVVFCLINPIVTPSALVYFALAALVERYNNIFVYRRTYESSGQLWFRLLNQVMVALYIFQLVMIGLLAIKKFPYTVLIVPVLIPTVAFHMVVLRLFHRPWSIMSLHDAAKLDINDQIADEEAVEAGGAAALADPDLYLSPVFKVHKGDLEVVLAELDEAAKVVEADVEKRTAEAEAAKAAKKK